MIINDSISMNVETIHGVKRIINTEKKVPKIHTYSDFLKINKTIEKKIQITMCSVISTACSSMHYAIIFYKTRKKIKEKQNPKVMREKMKYEITRVIIQANLCQTITRD